MPTKQQLHRVWESQFEFFGGSGQPKQNYEGSSEDNGLTALKQADTPLIPKYSLRVLAGEPIGVMAYDPDSNDLRVTVK